MIEKTILDYLTDALPVPVHMEMPRDPSGLFLVIEKTGSGVENHIYSATIAVQSYAPSLLEAAELNEDVKVAMKNLARLPKISKVDLNGDYNFTDLAMHLYRYQAVFEVIHYE